jgi:hypothetical protein
MSDIRQYVTSPSTKYFKVKNLVCSDVDILSMQMKNLKNNTFVIVLMKFHVIHGCNLVI